MLKLWEANIAESKKMAKEVNDDYEETFNLLGKGSLGIGKDDCPGLLGQTNIVRHQLKLKENLNEIQIEISQLKEIDVTQIDRWMVKPNLKLQSAKFFDKVIEDRLPKI